MGPYVVSIYYYISNMMQRYTVYLHMETALHVSCVTSTHQQKHQDPPDAVDTFICAPDDWWTYYPKHVEQFPDVNKMFNVAFCWKYSDIQNSLLLFHIHNGNAKA
jgi:hypothetical protein